MSAVGTMKVLRSLKLASVFQTHKLMCIHFCHTKAPFVVAPNIDEFLQRRDRYISEVITNFMELGKAFTRQEILQNEKMSKKHGNSLKFNKIKSVSHLCKDENPKLLYTDRTKSKNLIREKYRSRCLPSSKAILNKCFGSGEPNSSPDSCSFQSDVVDETVRLTNVKPPILDITKQIEAQLDISDIDKAYEIFEMQWNEKMVPSYQVLRTLTSLVSIRGYVLKVQVLQAATKYFYPKLFESDNCFEHYMCEALFKNGNFQESFSFLENSMKRYPKAKRLKEIASYIMNDMADIPERYAEQAFVIVCNFIKTSNQMKPAFSLWQSLIQSELYAHQCIANSILKTYPAIIKNKHEKLNALIEKAYVEDNVELLQRLTENFIQINAREPLAAATSALLSLYCCAENVKAANEIVKFAHEEHLRLTAISISLFSQLLNKLKMPTPLTILAFKYGYGVPKISHVKGKIKSPKFEIKFD